MARGRTAFLAVACVVLVSILGACNTSSSGSDYAAADRRSAAANSIVAARNRRAVARRRAAAAQRRARISTKPPSGRTTPTTIVTQASISRSGDVSAIRKTFDALNAAFDASVASGITSSAAANHWVADGTYTDNQCVAYELARSQGVVSERLVLHQNALSPSPGWVDPAIGKVPRGRIYRIAIDEIETLVPTGQQRARTLSVHVTVQSDGNARLLLRCH
jgi:hypothetical protein